MHRGCGLKLSRHTFRLPNSRSPAGTQVGAACPPSWWGCSASAYSSWKASPVNIALPGSRIQSTAPH
eukprot:9435340-Alexandrium_andersonii.AAC.1